MSAAALDLVKTLIAFDTTSRGSNLALIDFAQQLLESAGARCRRTFDKARIKANLFATFGPETPGGYVLSGHTDVVPVDGQDWSSDPFKAEVRGNRLFGRGACDMKGFLGESSVPTNPAPCCTLAATAKRAIRARPRKAPMRS